MSIALTATSQLAGLLRFGSTHCYVAIATPKRSGASGQTVLEVSQFVQSIPKVYAGAAAYCKYDIAIRLAFYVTDVVLYRLVILNLI